VIHGSAPFLIHASAVEIMGKGLLIVGSSGRGKSALALQLMAFGATLISDDRTEIQITSDGCIAKAPEPIARMIEARGVGLLHSDATVQTTVHLVVDLDETETDRLPVRHSYPLGSIDLPCLHNVPAPHFAAAVFQMMRAGRIEPE